MNKKDLKLLQKLSETPIRLDKFSLANQERLEELSINGFVILSVESTNSSYLYYVCLSTKGLDVLKSRNRSIFYVVTTVINLLISLTALLLTLLANYHG